MKKIILLNTLLLLFLCNNAYSAAISSITLADVWDAQAASTGDIYNSVNTGTLGADGSANRFGFTTGTTMQTWSGDTGTDMLWQGVNQAPGAFTTGFTWIGGDLAQPYTGAIFGNGANGDITNNQMTISSLDLGLRLTGVGGSYSYDLHDGYNPDTDTFKVNFLQSLGNGDYAIAFSWSHLITEEEDPSNTYAGFTTYNVIEGIAHTSPVPLPAAFWLFASGLIGLAGVANHKRNLGLV